MAAARSGWWRKSPDREATNSKDEELLVFGYSCKIFKDDVKASYIEKGQHLIPWMGDNNLMIDRFDARGHLHDLSQYETKPGVEYDSSLSAEEKAVEALCEEERYMALQKDLQDEEVRHEEELKRLRLALSDNNEYKEVQFDYDAANQQQADENEDKPFKVPSQLNVPPDMCIPQTVKESAIIEKTAAFIASHGTQMEIVLKTKQSGNAQFEFLSFDSPLNIYYKHVVQCIKDGKYTPQIEAQDDEEDDEDDDDHYLHPSLFAAKNESANQNNLTLYYPGTSQNDSAYSQLVDKLKDKVVHLLPIEGSNPGSQPESRASSPEPGNDTDLDDPNLAIIIPPDDMQQVIDKMAAYVAKNGQSFEQTVLAKGDPRFNFLKPLHTYNRYYRQRRRFHMHGKDGTIDRKYKKPVKVPVSFAIKAKEGEAAALDKSVLEAEEGVTQQHTHVSPVHAESAAGNTQKHKTALATQDKLKDKIASAARDRMAQITKDKMLQLERKRKAMLFLNMLKQSGVNVEANKSSQNSSPVTSNNGDTSLPTSAITSPVTSPLRSEAKSDPPPSNTLLSSLLAVGSNIPDRKKLSVSRSRSRSPRSSSLRYKSKRKRSRTRSPYRSSHRKSSKSSRYPRRSRSRSQSRSKQGHKSKKSHRKRHSSSESSS